MSDFQTPRRNNNEEYVPTTTKSTAGRDIIDVGNRDQVVYLESEFFRLGNSSLY